MTDGHCAAPGETIYVQNNVTTCSETGPGTSAQPLCSLQPVPALLPSRSLVVVRGTVSGGNWTYAGQGTGTLFIVGQQAASILALGAVAAIFNMQSGAAYIRSVKFPSSAVVGIQAKGGTLTLNKVTVDSCMGGGILLDGAAFDIENTTVTNNGPGQQPVVWGGILVNSLPASGSELLKLVSIQSNMAPGLTCSAGSGIQGDGVFASGNSTLNVTTACNVTPCSPMSPTCGAQ
jgi:hypothetical protein